MKDKEVPSRIELIDGTTLLTFARQVLKRDVQAVTQWSWQPLGGMGGQTILRFHGTASDGGVSIPWSLVLKRLLKKPDAVRRPSLRYWRREAEAYQSGLFNRVRGDFMPARCLAVEDFQDEIWLWMPEIQDEEPEQW